jgi:hypothetical protein
MCREALHQGVPSCDFDLAPHRSLRIVQRRFVRAKTGKCMVSSVLGHTSPSVMKSQNVMKGNIGIPAAEDGDIDSCPMWTTVSHRALPRLPSIPFGSWSQSSFSLPVNMDTLYLVSHGSLAAGDLYVSESPEGKDVSVKVFVHHRGSKALSRAAACQLSRGDGQVGVGIFVRWLLSARQIF